MANLHIVNLPFNDRDRVIAKDLKVIATANDYPGYRMDYEALLRTLKSLTTIYIPRVYLKPLLDDTLILLPSGREVHIKDAFDEDEGVALLRQECSPFDPCEVVALYNRYGEKIPSAPYRPLPPTAAPVYELVEEESEGESEEPEEYEEVSEKISEEPEEYEEVSEEVNESEEEPEEIEEETEEYDGVPPAEILTPARRRERELERQRRRASFFSPPSPPSSPTMNSIKLCEST